jgi:hypothetical protein
MSDTGLDEELDTPLGIMAITEVFIDRGGINYDNLLLARTCRRCGKMTFSADATDVSDRETYRVIVRTPDARMYVLRGSELLTAHCDCGCFSAIITYGPALHEGSGYTAYTIVELNGLSRAMACRLRDMRRLGDDPADVDEWVSGETVRGITKAVRRTAAKTFASVSEDWSESRYSSSWISL